MRKLRLIGIIIFAAWGGQSLYKYLSDDGRIFVSREKLPESETVSNASQQVPVEVQETTSMNEYFEAHKDDVAEIIKQSLTEIDSMEEYFEAHKNDYVKTLGDAIKDSNKVVKHKKAKYCVKIEHKNESVNEIILRHFER